ncbi:MAG: peptidyl-prolyl cis-trans isomerase [Deltaproteobacteria bacterium]|nr:peptidyl-prolyl cis-trans isomerase [Nannocystaceae bacterium]
MRAASRALVREPLVHFVILGALLFALDAVTSRDEADPPAESCVGLGVPQGPIVVGDAVRATLVAQWEQTHPAPPDAAQLERLVERWIDEEVLYREGLAHALAEGDAIVRERIASQMGYVLSSRIVVPEPTEDELRAAFHDNAAKWAQPDRVDFTQVYVTGRDDAARARAGELLGLLQGGADPDGLGDSFAGGRRFRGRRVEELAERFGAAFVEGIDAQPEGTWMLRRSEVGLHLVRIDRRSASRVPELDSVRDAVRHDWQELQRSAALQQATQELRSRWEVVVRP